MKYYAILDDEQYKFIGIVECEEDSIYDFRALRDFLFFIRSKNYILEQIQNMHTSFSYDEYDYCKIKLNDRPCWYRCSMELYRKI